MAELASFWAGDRLGPIEVASARSFLRHGDRLTVYATGPVDGLPDGVALRDANEVFPSDRLIRHRRTGSPALHTDLFRYALLARTATTWVDLDVVALRPFEFPCPWVFGYESREVVNGAVLRLPPDSPALARLLAYDATTRGLPPHVRGFRRVRYWLKSGGRGLTIDRWPWGSVGPRALTHWLRETGEIAHALPQSAFYAVPLAEVARFAEPGAIGALPADAWGVHLWGSALRRVLAERHGGRVPEGSFLARALAGRAP